MQAKFLWYDMGKGNTSNRRPQSAAFGQQMILHTHQCKQRVCSYKIEIDVCNGRELFRSLFSVFKLDSTSKLRSASQSAHPQYQRSKSGELSAGNIFKESSVIQIFGNWTGRLFNFDWTSLVVQMYVMYITPYGNSPNNVQVYHKVCVNDLM